MSTKILIVDDEIDILELLDYHLIKAGYKTMKASNGKEALLKVNYHNQVKMMCCMPSQNQVGKPQV